MRLGGVELEDWWVSGGVLTEEVVVEEHL